MTGAEPHVDFDASLERALSEGGAPDAGLPPAERQSIALACRLARAPFLPNPAWQSATRARLVAPGSEARPMRYWSRAPLAQLAGGMLALALLAVGLSWVFGGARPAPGGAPPLTATPTAPISNPPNAAAASSQPEGTPTPPPTTVIPTRLIGPDSSHAAIREAIARPVWDTLWIEGETVSRDADGALQKKFVQAWLSRDGKGWVLESDALASDASFPADLPVRRVWVTDGQTLVQKDLQTGEETRTALTGPGSSGAAAWASHPLESVDPLLEMIFPNQLSLLSTDLQVLGEDTWTSWVVNPSSINMPTAINSMVVIEWADSQMWVDEGTGLLLRRDLHQPNQPEAMTGEHTVVNQIAFNLQIPTAELDLNRLDGLTFESAPDGATGFGNSTGLTPVPQPTELPLCPTQDLSTPQPGTTVTPTPTIGPNDIFAPARCRMPAVEITPDPRLPDSSSHVSGYQGPPPETATPQPAPVKAESFTSLSAAARVAAFPIRAPSPVPQDLPLNSVVVSTYPDGHQEVQFDYGVMANDPHSSNPFLFVIESNAPELLTYDAVANPFKQIPLDLHLTKVGSNVAYLYWLRWGSGGNSAHLLWQDGRIIYHLALFGDWPAPDEEHPRRNDDLLLQIAASLTP